MPKAYNISLKVLSAEIKYDKDQPVAKDPYCVIDFGRYKYQTKNQKVGEDKVPKWLDEFELIYYQEAKLQISLYDAEGAQTEPRLICSGSFDISKKVKVDGENEVQMTAAGGKKAGILKINLKWLGDFELTPFRMDLVVHTVKILKRPFIRDLDQMKVDVRF
jgi:hypothetical protein